MRIVSPLLKRVVYPGLSRTGYLRWPRDAGPAVLTYHGILPEGYSRQSAALDGCLITAATFRSQLRLLTSKYNLISPEEFRLSVHRQMQLPPRSVLLTCDDGLLNTLTDMLPIIREFNVPFLFFVTGASLSEQRSMLWYEWLYLLLKQAGDKVSLRLRSCNQPYVAYTDSQKDALWQQLIRKFSALEQGVREDALHEVRIQIGISENWLSEYSQNEAWHRRFLMLNRSDLEKIADAGITIGAHSLSHPMLSQMAESGALREMAGSRRQLESALRREVWAFAYPFGTPQAATPHEAGMAQRAGFQCAFMNTETQNSSAFQLSRIHVSDGMSESEIEAHLCGFHRSIRQTFSQIASG